MSDTLAKLKVVLEAATSPYRKEMEKVKQVTKGVSETIQNETSKIKQASKMDGVTESVKKQASVIQKMKQAVTRYQVKAGIKVPTEDYKELQAGLEKAESSLGSLMEKQKKYEAIGVNKKGSSWKSLIYDIDEARNSVENYKNEISNMEADGTAFVKPFSTIKNIFKGLGSISLKGFGGMLKGVGAGVKTLSSGAIRVSSGVFGALIQKFASGVPILRRFVGAQKSVSGGFGGGLKNILKYTLGIRSLFVLINKLRSAAVEGFKNLAQYSGETNNSISMLMSSLTQLKNSVAAAFAPILNVVAPILNTLIQKIISVFNVIGQLTSALTGKSTYITARKVQQNYAQSLNNNAKSAKNAQKANKDLQRTILGFDQINKMDDNSSSDSDSDSGDTGSDGGLSPSDMFDTKSIPSGIKNLSDKIKQAWKNADFTEIGSIVGEKLNNALNSIPWGKIQNTCNKIAKSVATFLNGFLEKTDWGLVGSTLLRGINTIFSATNTFAKNFHWKSLGNAISNGINGAVRTFNAAQAAQAASNTLKGILDTFITAVENTNWGQIGEKIKEFIVNIDWNGIVTRLSEAIGAVFGGFAALIWGIIGDAWKQVVKWWKDTAFIDGKFCIDGLFKGILEVLKNIGAWLMEHVVNPFVNGFRKAFGIHSPSTVMAEQGVYIIQGLLNGIKNTIGQLLNYAAQIPGKVVNAIGNIKNHVLSKGTDIVHGLKNGVSNTWSSFTDTLHSIPKKIKNAVPNLFSVGKSIIQNFANGFSSIHIPMPHIGWDWTGGKINIGNWSFSLPRFNLQWYASGGFPEAGQLFVANEAGPEMVGKMGNKTTVANNNQIIEGIKAGVFEAVIDALNASGLLKQNNSEKEVVLEFTVKADSETLYKIVRKGKRKYDYRYAITETL